MLLKDIPVGTKFQFNPDGESCWEVVSTQENLIRVRLILLDGTPGPGGVRIDPLRMPDMNTREVFPLDN